MIAEFHREKCLFKEYINCEIPMLWECNRTINGIVHFDLPKIAIHDILIVQIENSKFHSALLWKCKNNHQFRLSLSDVKNKVCWYYEYMNLGLEFAQNLTNKRVGSRVSNILHSLGDVLQDIYGLLGLIVFKEGLAEIENVYPMFTSIIQHIYAGDVPKHMNGSLPSMVFKTKIIGVHIVLVQNLILK
ncbi:23307_t:CDS:2 [Gigaspora margarita]|uniref:23307_t:CDS:1 n=1 Tax=Gigaspora margarita TaxID=4874 RepID=A0ABN7UDD7_GIGMA|nr:23307_t:CDS:2 [Gigaspora margarita]